MTITPHIFEAYLKCPMKCWLRASGDTPLHDAAIQRHKEVAELLIAKGAEVNAIWYLDSCFHRKANERRKPEHHERRARPYTKAKSWKVIEVYRLDALSGKTVKDYPETKRMLAGIKMQSHH